MIMRFIQDHFLGAILLLSVMAIILGIIGTYISMFLLAIINLFAFPYSWGIFYGQ